MPRIAERDIAYVRDHSDIVSIVAEVVTLKRAGSALRGLCPFHDEKTPSFNVNPDRRMYHCFGCGVGGDAIKFVQEAHSYTFIEAVTLLAERLGHPLEVLTDQQANSTPLGAARTRLLEANAAAAAWFSSQLTTAAASAAVAFLTERGFTHQDAALFGVGYAPPGWHNLHHTLNRAGFTDEELVEAGLLGKGEKGCYDLFRDRLIFPIRDTQAKVIGFGARKLAPTDDGPKYLNTAETPLYRKSHALFGIDLARKPLAAAQETVIVEGYTDVMACHLAGITNTVATCGTAFGEPHARILDRLMGGGGNVLYLFDGDEAGQKAARKAFDLDRVFSAATFAVVLPDNQDPCEYRMAEGNDSLRDLVATNRAPLFAIVLAAAIGTVEFDQPESQAAALRRAVPILATISDPVLREQYTRKVASWTGHPVGSVHTAMRQAPTPRTTVPEQNAPSPESPHEGPFSTPPAHPALRAEREVLRILINHPGEADLYRGLVESRDIQHPTYRAVFSGDHPEDPVVQSVHRSLQVEGCVTHDDDDPGHVNTLVSFAQQATTRRLREVGNALTAQLSDADQQKAQRMHSHLVDRLRTLSEDRVTQ